ncbi:hypothetical protein [Pelotomaculum propionicicum]|uniref:Rubrerythrin n=1 Tax=Pelotomaculum propionicicum TaxID=258475 RepID=A0A4Y7RWQ8_9FIRM|nr:hypothetical protein [Pelotomaculum propionicicum]TEB13200.1 hypothetical protein Pmgp_00496 [Pelotomaculum propionicicum]
MDAKTEAMASNQMSHMCAMNPQMLLDMYVQSEQCEAPLYAQLAQMAPTPCLRQMIAQMAMEEPGHTARLAALAAAYGLGASAPMTHGGQIGMAPQFFSVEEKKE